MRHLVPRLSISSFNKLTYVLLLLASLPLLAQDSSLGMPYFSTRSLGVDLATSNVYLNIPIRSKIGAIPFSASFALNSHIFIGQNVIGGVTTHYIGVSAPNASPTVDGFFHVSSGRVAQAFDLAGLTNRVGCPVPSRSVRRGGYHNACSDALMRLDPETKSPSSPHRLAPAQPLPENRNDNCSSATAPELPPVRVSLGCDGCTSVSPHASSWSTH